MNTLKIILLAFTLAGASHIFASDCSVGYAHLKNGKYKQAYNEFRTLAERGYPIYMNMMGDMHLKGQGVPSSKMIAHVWYSLSAAQKNDKGMNSKFKLAQELSPEQLADSRYFAKEYAKDYLEPYIAGWSLDK